VEQPAACPPLVVAVIIVVTVVVVVVVAIVVVVVNFSWQPVFSLRSVAGSYVAISNIKQTS
jgi:hypothetical protein